MIQRELKQNPLKATVILCFFVVCVSVFTDCSQSGSSRKIGDMQIVAKNVGGLIVCDKSLLNETITIPLSAFTAEELQILKLDDSDEALVKNNAAVISDNYILVQGSRPMPYKLFDKKTGKFITNIGAYGQGPNEYVNVYDQQIDESNNRIYLLPWQAGKILVYDLKGNALEPIPLCFNVPKGGFKVDTKAGTVKVAVLPFTGAQAVVWQQTFDGKMLNYIAPGHIALPPDFSNEVFVYKDDNVFDFFVFSFAPRADTLYRYDWSGNKLIPLFTCDLKGLKSIHFYTESSKYFFGDLSEPVQVSATTTTTQNHRFYFVDKQTLKGSYFTLENDFLGNVEIQWPIYALSGEYYVYNADPGNLRDELEKQLESGKDLTPVMRDKLTKLKNSITDNDNNYILYAKLKK